MRNEFIDLIARSVSEWEIPHVEHAIYGTAEPSRIASALDRVCRDTLQSPPCEVLFYRASVGSVAGVQLEDGRRVVVKAHQPRITAEHLTEVVRLQSRIAAQLGLAPRVLAGPVGFAHGHAILEEFAERGSIRNGHDPVVRRHLSKSLHAIIECLSCERDAVGLPAGSLLQHSPGQLWPTPHSKLFDFEATSSGAAYIDRIALEARSRMIPAGRTVIGHGDWRTEHVRFTGDTLTIGFDWDSLCKAREPALVGATAHMFCADWSREGHIQAPTLAEARAFVSDYEAAADRQFSAGERLLCGAAFAFAVAYTSRCGHAAGVDTRNVPGTFQHLLVTEGTRLFDL